MARARRSTRPSVVVMGLDLSLTGTGAVVLPEEWVPGSWEGVEHLRVDGALPKGASEQELVERLGRIVDAVCALACRRLVRHVFVEEYGFNMAGASRAHRMGELGGAAKLALLDCLGRAPVPVVASSARKLLLGAVPRLPRGGLKAHVQQRLAELSPPWRTHDEGDAFVVANFGRSELGLPALTFV